MSDFTQEQLSAMNAAIASGEQSVSYNGTTVTYRSLAELIAARDMIRRELSPVSDTSVSYASYSKGF